MGNSNSNSSDFKHNIDPNDFTVVRKFQDFLLGEFYEVKNNLSGELLLMKMRTVNDPERYKQSIDYALPRLSLSHKNLAKVRGFAGKESKTSFSTIYKIYVYFEPLPKDLARFLKSRKNPLALGSNPQSMQKYLSEVELSNIMTQLIDVLEYLQANKISHGDIRPEACFMTEGGKLIICDRKLIYEEELKIGYEKNVERNFLFSPIAFNAFVKQQKNTRENKHKSDVFSVGLTLLESATLKRSAHIYEWAGTPTINFNTLITRLAEVQNRYSPFISQLLGEMLKVDEHQRPDFSQLKKWVTGTEYIKRRNLSFPVPSEHQGPHLNRANIGPKLVGFSPKVNHNHVINPNQTGKIALKTLQKDDVPQGSGSNSHEDIPENIRGFKRESIERDDEDEVVEFETEETPKRGVFYGSNSLYQEVLSGNSKPLTYNKNKELFGSDLYSYQSSPAKNSQFDLKSYINQENLNDSINEFDEKESTFGKVDNSNGKGNLDLQELRTLTSIRSGVGQDQDIISGYVEFTYARDQKSNEGSFKSTFAHPSIDTTRLNKITLNSAKGSFLEGNNAVFTPSTGAYTYNPDPALSKVQSATTKTENPFSNTNSPIGVATVNPFNTYTNNSNYSAPLKTIHHKSTSEGYYASKPTDIYGPSAYNHYNPSPYSTTQNNLPEIPSLSMIQSSEPNFYLSNKSLVEKNGLDSSIHFDAGGETEQYRSLCVDGLTYSSIPSIGPSTPKMDKNSGDLLSRISSAKSYNNSDHVRNYSDPYSQWESQSSRNSFDLGIGLTTPQFRNYIETGFSGQGSRNSLANSGTHTPTEHIPYNLKNFNIDNSPLAKLKDLESDDLFKKALERSKETYELYNRSLKSSMSEDLRKSRPYGEQVSYESPAINLNKY